MLKQSIELARAPDFPETLARTGEALAALRKHHADGTLPLLRLPEKRDDVSPILGYARLLQENTTDVVWLGTGGSSLGGQTLAQLAGHAVPALGALRKPRLHFLDNLDPGTFEAMLEQLPLAIHALRRDLQVGRHRRDADADRCGHRRAQGRQARSARSSPRAQRAGQARQAQRPARSARPATTRRCSTTIPASAAASRCSATSGCCPPRFAASTSARSAPAQRRRWRRCSTGKPPAEVPAAVGAALSMASGKPITVMMAYSDRLDRFTKWYVQLWAESLGKDGKGTTPIAALGPVDQHSQLQLYIAGPRDKLFTILTVGAAGRGPRIDAELAKRAHEPGLGGKTIGDLVAAQGRATAETLAKNGCQVRTIHIEKLDEAALGELLMHFMLETIIAAHLLGVDPFDQPAVEEGKVLAKKYLAG